MPGKRVLLVDDDKEIIEKLKLPLMVRGHDILEAYDGLRALEVIRRRCPLPGICGRVCHHPCELACRRARTDEAVAIRSLKRFVADRERELPRPSPPPGPAPYSRSFETIGNPGFN